MSGRSSPVNGGYETPNSEPAMRLTVRKDLFPEERLPTLASAESYESSDQELDLASGVVKLETDFEQSIDEIAQQKLQSINGDLPSKPRHKKHKQHSKRDVERSAPNGILPPEKKRRKSPRDSHQRTTPSNIMLKVKGGKNLNLVSSSEYHEEEDDDEVESEEESESSDDEMIVKLPLIVSRQSGKPYSHQLSQLSTKKSKSKNSDKERRTHAIPPCGGKPRSMLDIRSSKSKKKSKKSECAPTYHSQIVDANTIKIKIRRTSAHEVVTPTPIPVATPISISDLGQRKSKKKRAATPEVSESSGEEYDPSRGDTAAAMSVGAPKARNPRPSKARKQTSSTKPKANIKEKREKTERNKNSATVSKDVGPQSPWASIPEEILVKIFEMVVNSQGTLPSVIRLGKVCKHWHSVSLRPELWKHVDLAQHTSEKCKTDYKLVWLLENRLSKCQSLNIAQWKVCNVSWVLACVGDYCPELVELSVAGWSRITPEQLFEVVQGLPKLQRLDLSLTSETAGSNTCLTAASMARLLENFGERFTHLTMANNKFTALPQILSSVAAHCPNLEVLDISGAQATSHPAAVPLEALQKGCPKMRVFRAANAQLVLATVPSSKHTEIHEWTQLEELSIAGEAASERVLVGEYRLGDDALGRLVRGATRLRLLDLRGLQRLTDSGLIRVPAWDLQHLFLGGCNVTRQNNACLELICEKWSHSLIEIDLSWASAEKVLDAAVSALGESNNSKLRILNLCGSCVSFEAVKKVLLKCPHLESLNLSSCRALPRGMKRLYAGKELQDLKDSLDPEKVKAKELAEQEKAKKKKEAKKNAADSKSSDVKENKESSNVALETSSNDQSGVSPCTDSKLSEVDLKSPGKTSLESIRSPSLGKSGDLSKLSEYTDVKSNKSGGRTSTRDTTPILLSPMAQSKPDSSCTPTSESGKTDFGSPHFSPIPKPDSQVLNSPEVQNESLKGNSSWNLGQFKTTPTHKSEASPLNRLETHRIKHSKVVEQCSPTTSLENKPSPETVNIKQDMKNPNSWNYGQYSPLTRQDNQFSSQRSPYSAQPSPAQPSPYSAQPSPYSTQPSPYSSQPSPYSAQPSPDTSQMVKTDLQKTNAWNTGNFSPMPKHPAPFSPHPSTHASPDPGLGVKSDSLRSNPNKTPGQYSPMSRQDRIHQSPYSPRPSVDNSGYNKKSPAGVGNYSPMMRQEYHLPSPDGNQASSRSVVGGRQQEMYNRSMAKEVVSNVQTPEVPGSWNMDRFNQLSNIPTSVESLVWGATSFGAVEPPAPLPRVDTLPSMLTTPPAQTWNALPSFDDAVRRSNTDISDQWSLGPYREDTSQVHNTFDTSVNFDSLSSLGAQAHNMLQNFLDDNFSERSRVD